MFRVLQNKGYNVQSTTEEIQKLSKETKAKIEKYLEGENSESKFFCYS